MSLAEPRMTMKKFKDQHGRDLLELSQNQNVLVIFLRHFGCTFCREALDDIAKRREQIESDNVQIALVHMSPAEKAEGFLQKRGLSDLPKFSDPNKRLYTAFNLRRGSLWQLFGVKSWIRGIEAGLLNKHGLGKLAGDGFQMPGVFLIRNGEVLNSFVHQSASDRPDYVEICKIPASHPVAKAQS